MEKKKEVDWKKPLCFANGKRAEIEVLSESMGTERPVLVRFRGDDGEWHVGRYDAYGRTWHSGEIINVGDKPKPFKTVAYLYRNAELFAAGADFMALSSKLKNLDPIASAEVEFLEGRFVKE